MKTILINVKIKEKENFRWLETMKASSNYIPEGKECIHLCDREGDFYELFDFAEQENERFVIRIIQNRMTVDGRKIMDKLKSESTKGSMIVHIGRNPKTKIPERDVLMNYTYIPCSIKRPARRKEEHLIM